MPFRPADSYSYSALLGYYLGDGCVVAFPRTWRLVIACDATQPEIIEDVVCAAQLTALDANVSTIKVRGSRCINVSSYGLVWRDAFPQAGPGRKHERKIALERWQQEIVEAHPWQFLKGLLHSDGCRSINRVKTTLPSGRYAEYEYPRWYFVNASEDILGIFGEACDRVGVRWTRSRERMITVSRRPSVELLDEHVGLKG